MRERAAPLALAAVLATGGAARAGAPLDGLLPVRGVTVGPIESTLHPGRGYGSPPCARTMSLVARQRATWVSLTPFGRVNDLAPTGIDPSFEAPWQDNRRAVAAAIRQAHAVGLRVMLVPHLWVESGEWRARIDPGTDAGWARWADAYRRWLLGWAELARDEHVDLLSVGVELRSWVTTTRATSFAPIIDAVRAIYPGPLTYSANWDDVDDTVILGQLDVIGVNAFYPLAEREGAGLPELLEGGARVAEKVRTLAATWHKPVLFTEIGYTTRPDPALRPWEWPDEMKNVRVDEAAQADAYLGLVAPLLDEPAFAGFFVWRVYADPDDVSQEAEWGFSPRGKRAELVVRDAFGTWWAADGPRAPGDATARERARIPGVF